jgi:putative nucleotidyltransferase with HDIG domain
MIYNKEIMRNEIRIEKVKKEVESLYTSHNPHADPWIIWAYPNHVLVVAQNAERLATEQKANKEFCVAGALLHDIADAVIPRFSENHEKESLRIANEILEKCGYSEEECTMIVNEIIAPHSCSHTMPKTLEGKILATADAMAHFQTDFFLYFAWQHLGGKELVSLKKWVLEKSEKHFNKKIFFEEYREEIEPEYTAVKLLFSK